MSRTKGETYEVQPSLIDQSAVAPETPVSQAVVQRSEQMIQRDNHDVLGRVLDAALDPAQTHDPARLEKFLAIARELQLDQKKQEWATAFRAAKDEIDCYKITKRGQIVYEGKKGGVVKFIKYEDIAKAVKPILSKYKLSASYTFRYEQAPPKAICIMNLLHANSYSQNFESIPLPMIDSSGGKNDVQGAGSVMKYGRRYVTCGAFDIVAEDEDTDGGTTLIPITDMQAADAEQFIRECEAKEPEFRRRFMRWLSKEARAETIKDLCQGEQYRTVMAKLSEKCQSLGI